MEAMAAAAASHFDRSSFAGAECESAHRNPLHTVVKVNGWLRRRRTVDCTRDGAKAKQKERTKQAASKKMILWRNY